MVAGTCVTLDPGLRACGVALWYDGVLVRAGAVRGPGTGRGPAVWAELADGVARWVEPAPPGVLVVETMKVYVAGKGDPADLIELSGVAGAVVGRLAAWRAEGVKAAEWNRQVPSHIQRQRSRAWVEQHGWIERVDLATTARFQEDVWSAVGIGRWRMSQSR